MLKRQRPASPPPSARDIPLMMAAESLMDAPQRTAKRRRVLPPLLDGKARGWGLRGDDNIDYDNEEDDEEEESASEESVHQNVHDAGQYKSTNSFLHDLHALHQHRLIFSSSPPHLHLTPNQRQYINSHGLFHPDQGSSPIPGKVLPPLSECPRPHSQLNQCISIGPMPQSGDDGNRMDEVQRVKERYEETNKFVKPA